MGHRLLRFLFQLAFHQALLVQVLQFVGFLAIFVSPDVLRRRQVVGVRHRFLPVDF